MSATALLKFSQGSVVGGAGEALIVGLGTSVNLTNADNSDVRSWQLDLVSVDPTSAFSPSAPYAYNNNGNVPSLSITPDVRGSYRWVLKVWNLANRPGDPVDVDIRNFAVPELNGFIVLPQQLFPIPLPDPRSGLPGAKPNELNFGNQLNGFAGDGNSDGLMNRLIRSVDGSRVWPFQVDTTTAGPHELCRVDTSKWPQNCYVRAVFDVIVDNAAGNNVGYFDRTSIYRRVAGSLTHLATGERIFANVPADDGALSLNTSHVIKATADSGRYIVLTGTPSGATSPELDLVWKVSAQFYLSIR